jgi:2Fe-2S ferredoxin
MITIRFIDAVGEERVVQGSPGDSLMTTAVDHRIAGILAECGGFCACATCHVYVPPEWMAKLPAADPNEAGLLTGAIRPTSESRLACQITLTAELDGLTVRLPVHQI